MFLIGSTLNRIIAYEVITSNIDPEIVEVSSLNVSFETINAYFCSKHHIFITSKDSTLGLWNFKLATNFEFDFLKILDEKFYARTNEVWDAHFLQSQFALLQSCSVPKICAILSKFSSTDLLNHLKPLFEDYIRPMFKHVENYFHASLLFKCKIWFSTDPTVREKINKAEL